MRAVIYARVSSDDRKNDGRNLEDQLEMCRDFVEQRGWNIISELAEDDRGASGASFELPELNRVREMARNGDFDVLVVREIDRLSRRLAKQLVVEEELKRSGVLIEYVIGDYPDTPEGNFMKHVRATVAEFEREKINERMVRGRRREVKRGSTIVHGRAPFGYSVFHDGDKYQLEISEEQALIVRLIFEWYTVGENGVGPLSMRKISRKLGEMGIPTPTGKIRKEWPRATVARILSSETYVGTWYYGKFSSFKSTPNPIEHRIAVDVPAIIDSKTWEHAQELRSKNKENSRRNTKYNYLLSKRMTCPKCGYKMTTVGHVKGGYRYYRCPAAQGYHAYDRECDNNKYFRVDHVDSVVWAWIRSLFQDPERLAEGYELYLENRETTIAPLLERLKVLDDLITKHEQKLERLLDLYLSQDIGRDMLVDRKERLEKDLKEFQSDREELLSHISEGEVTVQQIKHFQTFVAEASKGIELIDGDEAFTEKRRIVDLLDVQAELSIRDGEQVVAASCILGEEVLLIVSPNTYNLSRPGNHSPNLARQSGCGVRSGQHRHRQERPTHAPNASLL